MMFHCAALRLAVVALSASSLGVVAVAPDGFTTKKYTASPLLSISPRYGPFPPHRDYVTRTVYIAGIGVASHTGNPTERPVAYSCDFRVPIERAEVDDIPDILHQLYDKKLGELGYYWIGPNVAMDYKYAKVKLGDVFDFYTNSQGELKFPPWTSFKFVIDQYLDEDPRVKYHPSRVRHFIDANGIEMLETME